ncbi:MAG: hypothetical protein RL757_2961 [Bacteroidota bacterium]
MTKSIALTAFLGLAVQSATAQKYSNEYLSIGVGARAHGLSGAVSASGNDVFSSYWNPAALTDIKNPLQIGAMHAEWFAGIAQYDFLGIAKSLGEKRSVGFSFIRLGIDNIPNTLNLVAADGSINYNNVTAFSAADYAFLVSYAQKMRNPNLSVGGNLKVIRRVIGQFAGAWGVGVDLSMRYRAKNWTFAAVGRDLTTTYNAWTATLTDEEKRVFTNTGNAIPKGGVEITRPTLVFGANYRHKFNANYDLNAEADATVTTDGQRNTLLSSSALSIDPKFGLELGYQNFLWLRVGAGTFQRFKRIDDPTKKDLEFQPNLGLGLRVGRLTIDYALTNIGNVSQVNYSNIISLKLDFKRKKTDGEELLIQ